MSTSIAHTFGTDGRERVSIRIGNTVSIVHVDHLKSTRLLSNASGVLTDQIFYRAFGEVLQHVGGTPITVLFGGESHDAITGLDYLHARYYDSTTGRFVSRDPAQGQIEIPLSMQPFAYGYLNPVSNSDPSGRTTLMEQLTTTQVASTVLKAGLVNGAVSGLLGSLSGNGFAGGFVAGFVFGAGVSVAGEVLIASKAVEVARRIQTLQPVLDKITKIGIAASKENSLVQGRFQAASVIATLAKFVPNAALEKLALLEFETQVRLIYSLTLAVSDFGVFGFHIFQHALDGSLLDVSSSDNDFYFDGESRESLKQLGNQNKSKL